MRDAAVYLDADVASVQKLWVQSGAEITPVVSEQLAAFAGSLRAARASGERAASVLVWNRSRGDHDQLSTNGSLSERDARLIVARDHGFAAWEQVTGRCDPSFERAVGAVVMGRLEELRSLLIGQPELVTAQSAYGHRATLLHYTAANGVEIRRQSVPQNADLIAALLLSSGADAVATLNAYGGSYDTLAMLKSSAHPARVGTVAARLERVLAGSR